MNIPTQFFPSSEILGEVRLHGRAIRYFVDHMAKLLEKCIEENRLDDFRELLIICKEDYDESELQIIRRKLTASLIVASFTDELFLKYFYQYIFPHEGLTTKAAKN